MFLPGAILALRTSYLTLPVAGTTEACPTHWLQWGLLTFLSGLALERSPPNISFLSSSAMFLIYRL
jgi:hypothetical protein